MRTKRPQICAQRGAAFVEFSIGMVAFALAVAAIFEVGVSFHRKNRAESAAISAAQDIRMHYTRKEVPGLCGEIIPDGIDGAPCQKLEECAVHVVQERIRGVVPLRDNGAGEGAGVSLSASLTPSGASARLTLEGKLAPGCLICGAFPALHFNIGQDVTIQNRILCTS